MKRLNYNLFKSKQSVIKYLVVIEFQKRGAVHYHAVFFNLAEEYVASERTTRRIADVWKQGFIDIMPMREGYEIALYLGKYLTKAKIDERLIGQKRYFASRGLFKPIEYSLEKISGAMVTDLVTNHTTQFTREYESKHSGLTRYRTFVLPDEELAEFRNMYNAEL